MTSPFARCLSRNLFIFQRSFTTRNSQHRLLYNTVKSNLLKQQIIYEPKYVMRLFSTNKDDSDEKNNKCAPEVKLGLFQRYKQMYRDYWYVLLPVHIVTSIGWFGGFYYMAKSGVDIIALMESMGFNENIINPLKDSSMGYLAVSFALYKIATPFRYTVTLGGTTISIKYLKEWGYIKPVPSKCELKEMYKEKKNNIKESLQESKDHLKETIQERSAHIKETLQEQKEHLKETYKEKKIELKHRKDQLKETIQETKEELRQRKDQLRERKDNIMGDYATFKQELKDIKTKTITKVAAAPKQK